MNSLRSRLILGSALIALIPLAAAMLLLGRRVETMVRTEAAERLSAALAGLEIQIHTDGERITEQLQILARDPQLRRLYLVQPEGGRDLADYLAERRILLGLDFLRVADTRGRVVATGDATAAGAPQAAGGDRAVTVEEGAPILYQGAPEGVVTGGLALDAGFLSRLKRVGGVDLIVRDAHGRFVASTLSRAESAAVATSAAPASADIRRLSLSGRSYLSRDRALPIGAPPHPRITALVATAAADRTIAALQWTSLLLGLLGLVLAILLGTIWSSQISRPVERLAAFSHRVAQGEWDEPLSLESVRELETLVQALDHMRGDLRAYRDRLVISERQAAWSQMARKVAHEVKNPLTPIAISVADLKRSFEQQRSDFPQILDQAVRTIGEEVEALKRLLQEFADFARMPPARLAPCRVSDLFADLEALYAREVAEGRLCISGLDREIGFEADRDQIRQALVNLVKNGLEAIDGHGCVKVSAKAEPGALLIAVGDTGPGLTAEQRARLFTPGFTTKSQGSGLGLTIVQRIVHDHQGSIAVDAGDPTGPDTGSRIGTTFRIRLPRDPEA
jgi:signal transduction histidine kinase